MRMRFKIAAALAPIAFIGAYWGRHFPVFSPSQEKQLLQPSANSRTHITSGVSEIKDSIASPANNPASANLSPEQAFLAMANDASIPADEREARIMDAGKHGVSSVSNLMVLADANTYFSFAAIKSLGQIPKPEVQAYLATKLKDLNPRVINAAVESLAQIQGGGAVSAIVQTLTANRVRPDGFEDMVCANCVDTLGKLRSPAALPALQDELVTTVGTSLGFDYGSKVVKAIKQIGDPSAVPMLLAYLDKLKAEKKVGADNPKAQQYLQSSIDEVLAVVAKLQK